MKSVMGNKFSIAPSANIQRSSFNRDHGNKTTFDADYLIPIFVDEALPGDTFNLKGHHFARLATPIYPIMDNMFFETFYFEVPVRQVWTNWQKFNGEQENPGDSTDYLIPEKTSPAGGYLEQSLDDYFGLPIGVENLEHSALFHRAYYHIWNEWFRDQNLQDTLVKGIGDGPDVTNYVLQKRGKRHDYFTSALPWPQKSDAGSVQIPLGDTAPVIGTGTRQAFFWDSSENDKFLEADATNNAKFTGPNPSGDEPMLWATDNTNLSADLTEATAATINQLRQSIAVQRLFEKDARGGTRYIEVIYNHFKVRSPDLRLQRPGYLGGGRTQINITPVAQTTPDPAGPDDPTEVQGSLAAFGTINANNHGFTKSFTEHSIIIGLACVRADLTYQNCLNRMWSRKTRFDHYWPELATIGEQTVLRKEIHATGVNAEDDTVFGYQERFAEYRYKPSTITGRMRSVAAEPLDAWHLSQEFANAPVLDTAFIEQNTPLDRAIAVPSEPHFIMDSYFRLQCARPMPMYGIPGLDKL